MLARYAVQNNPTLFGTKIKIPKTLHYTFSMPDELPSVNPDPSADVATSSERTYAVKYDLLLKEYKRTEQMTMRIQNRLRNTEAQIRELIKLKRSFLVEYTALFVDNSIDSKIAQLWRQVHGRLLGDSRFVADLKAIQRETDCPPKWRYASYSICTIAIAHPLLFASGEDPIALRSICKQIEIMSYWKFSLEPLLKWQTLRTAGIGTILNEPVEYLHNIWLRKTSRQSDMNKQTEMEKIEIDNSC
ncbi:hypothetical protein D918_00188 [Trichuris suis]|nr:hypothetical protein D918_00188 [Trichuris suis]